MPSDKENVCFFILKKRVKGQLVMKYELLLCADGVGVAVSGAESSSGSLSLSVVLKGSSVFLPLSAVLKGSGV